MGDGFCAKHKRLAACIMGVMMLFVVLFSSYYLAEEADHHCYGEDCPICACMEQCENTLHQMGDGLIILIAAVLPALVFFFTVLPAVCELCRETPISQKVRLNN